MKTTERLHKLFNTYADCGKEWRPLKQDDAFAMLRLIELQHEALTGGDKQAAIVAFEKWENGGV